MSTKYNSLKEYEVIQNVVLYLINKNAKIIKVSVRKKELIKSIKEFLKNNGISENVINQIEFKTEEEDIIANLRSSKMKTIRKLVFEVKGGERFYSIYTALGQFICSKKSLSTYYWFAFAFPYSWRKEIRKKLLYKNNNNNNIVPIVLDIIERYTKKGNRLYFYFVKDNGEVIKETWRQTLSKKL